MAMHRGHHYNKSLHRGSRLVSKGFLWWKIYHIEYTIVEKSKQDVCDDPTNGNGGAINYTVDRQRVIYATEDKALRDQYFEELLANYKEQ